MCGSWQNRRVWQSSRLNGSRRWLKALVAKRMRSVGCLTLINTHLNPDATGELVELVKTEREAKEALLQAKLEEIERISQLTQREWS